MGRKGHFACLGFDTEDENGLKAMIERLWGRTKATPRKDGGRMLTWQDASGARLVMNADEAGKVTCVSPGFAGSGSMHVRVESIRPDECRHCDVLVVQVLEGDRMAYPMALQVDDIGIARDVFEPKSVHDLNVTVFLEEDFKVRSAEDAATPLKPGEFAMGPECLIPSGLFPGDDVPGLRPRALVILSGRVISSEVRTNGAAQGRFLHALVQTYAGTVDVVAPSHVAPRGLRAGRIISGSFWVVGHLVPRRRWWPWGRAVAR